MRRTRFLESAEKRFIWLSNKAYKADRLLGSELKKDIGLIVDTKINETRGQLPCPSLERMHVEHPFYLSNLKV